MDIKEELKRSDKTSACVKFFSNKDGKYILCPYGRSPSKKWIGLAKLNYFITGNYKIETKENLLNNIYNCLNVSMNYDKLNIEKCMLKDDILSKFVNKAKKEKYDGFSVVSIDIEIEEDCIEVVEWERVGKTSNEWRGNPENFISISYNDFDIKVVDAIYKLIKCNKENISINCSEVVDNILKILKKEKRIKYTIDKVNDLYLIKIKNYQNNNQQTIIVGEHIFFQVDDEEYFELNDYEKAMKIFLTKLDSVVDVIISYINENNEKLEIGFNELKKDINLLTKDVAKRLKNDYSFIKNIIEIRIENFYGDFNTRLDENIF